MPAWFALQLNFFDKHFEYTWKIYAAGKTENAVAHFRCGQNDAKRRANDDSRQSVERQFAPAR